MRKIRYGNYGTASPVHFWVTSLCAVFVHILLPSLSHAFLLIGGEVTYRVTEGDTLELIGAKLGVEWRSLLKHNGIDEKAILRIGQEIRANTRKIVPKVIDDGIVINIPERMLYFFRNGELRSSFPAGVGMHSWRTPTGHFTVVSKQRNPTWYVPRSIQQEMSRKGVPVRAVVPPGPDNPLGRYAIKLSLPGVLIHETIWPSSVYQFRSHGCIRLLPRDIEAFFRDVEIGDRGEILYMPIKIAVSDQGRVYFEVHRDAYKEVRDMRSEARKVIELRGLSDKVNWDKVETMLKEQSGVADDVTL